MILQFLIQNILLSQLSFFLPKTIEKLDLGVVVSEVVPEYNYDTDLIDVNLQAKSVIAVDAVTGDVLYKKNINEQRSIASITKLMTVLVFLDQNIDMSTRVKIRATDRKPGGIEHFNIGETVRVADLLYSALIASDNDAAYALSRSTGLTNEQFVELMNEKAKELKMYNTVFTEPTGLDFNNKSIVKDLVLLLQEASKNTTIADATSRRSYSFEVIGINDKERTVRLYSTDSLTNSKYLNLITGKTGYIPQAMYSLAAKIKGQNGRVYYIIVLGSKDIQSRFQDLKAIEYYINNKYKYAD